VLLVKVVVVKFKPDDVPAANAVPVADEYHVKLPPHPLAAKVVLLPLQIVVPLTVGADGILFTVTIAVVRLLSQLFTVQDT
jgi:hypothetical protein